MATIPVSVIVCTRNRLDKLRRCLDAFGRIKTEHQWELVIVDNGSTDGTDEFLASLPARIAGATVKTVCEPRQGLAIARNTGVGVSRGDIVAFTDDDCYVAPDYIDAMAHAFDDATIGFIGGRILLYDRNDLPITINESERYEKILPYKFIRTGNVQGANMAFRRSILKRIGGFDEIFGRIVACEDTDAIARASWAGVSGAYDPKPTVFHHHERKTKRQARKIWAFYQRGRGAYYAKCILNPASRRTYIQTWAKMTFLQLRGPTTMRSRVAILNVLRRELAGALYYFRKAKGRANRVRTS